MERASFRYQGEIRTGEIVNRLPTYEGPDYLRVRADKLHAWETDADLVFAIREDALIT